MKKETKKRGDSPRFDLLLLACLGVVGLVGLLVWATMKWPGFADFL
ncbi:MAG TPA: hypothetical protein VFT37_09195 [Telluria sp.]|nr:hypothetical protein [Telluria sp.]